MKTKLLSFLIGFTILFINTSCDDKDYNQQLYEIDIISDIKINETLMDPLPLLIGKDTLLTCTIVPTEVTDPSVIWTSGDNTIATIDKNGKIKAIKEGEVFISVVPLNGYAASSVLKIKVISQIVYITSINITNTNLEIYETEQLHLNATVTPSDATFYKLKWSSSDESIAEVSKDGIVSGIKKGTATITAQSIDGSNIKKSIQITVKESIKATDIAFTAPKLELGLTEINNLPFVLTPADATLATIDWKSDNNSVVEVNNGIVNAKTFGQTTITATTSNGVSASIIVSVEKGKMWHVFDSSEANKFLRFTNGTTVEAKDDHLSIKGNNETSKYGYRFRGDQIVYETYKNNSGQSKSVFEYFAPKKYPIFAMKVDHHSSMTFATDFYYVTTDGSNIYPKDKVDKIATTAIKNTSNITDFKTGIVYCDLSVNQEFKNATFADENLILLSGYMFNVFTNNISVGDKFNLYWIKTFESVLAMEAYLEATEK